MGCGEIRHNPLRFFIKWYCTGNLLRGNKATMKKETKIKALLEVEDRGRFYYGSVKSVTKRQRKHGRGWMGDGSEVDKNLYETGYMGTKAGNFIDSAGVDYYSEGSA